MAYYDGNTQDLIAVTVVTDLGVTVAKDMNFRDYTAKTVLKASWASLVEF